MVPTTIEPAPGLNTLGRTLLEAEPLRGGRAVVQRALAIREKELGPDHPLTATSLNNLALLYSDQCRYEEAALLYRRALEIEEKGYGPEHPETALDPKNYVIVLHKLGREDEARAIEARYKLKP